MTSSTGGVLGSLKKAFGGGHKDEVRTDRVSTPPASADNASLLSSGPRQVDDPVPASHANDVAPTSTTRTTNDVGPMSTTHTSDDGPMSTTRTAHTSTTMGPGADLDQPASTHTGTMGGGAALPEEGGHRSVGTVIKEAFSGAPWEPRHERTMEALTHAKTAHIKAVQAQAELQAAQKARQDAELAERHRMELEQQTTLYTQGQNDLDARTREYEAAKQALAEHHTNHENAARLAQEAEAAALAKEQEANGMLPLLEEHERTLGPLQNEAMAHQRTRAEAEERRAALVRELEALDAALGGHRSNEAAALEKLEEQQRLHKGHGDRALALAEEARLLRLQANEAHTGLGPHAQRLKDAHGLLAVKESAYNKARTAAEAGRDKLPNLQGQADEAARIAHASAMAAQEHAGAFEKLKREAEVEDAKKTELWSEVQKSGHFTDDNASRTELHNLADRFHTVLTHPIDTKRLAGPNVTSEIQQTAARITGNSPRGGSGMGATTMDGVPGSTRTTTMAHDTTVDPAKLGREMTGADNIRGEGLTGTRGDGFTSSRGDGFTGSADPSFTGDRSMIGSGTPPRGSTMASQPGMIRKATSVTTPAHGNFPAAMREE